MLVSALPQINTSVFHLWKSIDLDSAWVRYSLPCQFSFVPRILAHLEMRHNRVSSAGIPSIAYLPFWRRYFWPSSKSTHVYFICKILSTWTVLRLNILTYINFYFSVSSFAFRDAPHSRFKCGDPNQCLPNFLKMLLLALPSNLDMCISLVEV